MTIAAAKVKEVCSKPEVELVRASRKPHLDKHSEADLKKLATRSRKLFDKWQAQGRKQARSRGNAAGAPEKTQLKTQIFREALDAFESRLANVAAAGPGNAATGGGSKTKKSRAAEHRQSRAAVRTGMTAALDLENQSRSKGKAPKKKAAAAKSAETDSPAASPKPVKKKSTKKPSAPSKLAAKVTSKKPAPGKPPAASKQMRAKVVAKEKRLKQSGKTTRVLGHVSARGKRSQARRDSKN